jgi:hypothetical protein
MEAEMDFDDLVQELAPTPNRIGRCEGEFECHLPEGAVMVAYALHLLRTTKARRVLVHPDGKHGKRFDFAGWLAKRGFERTSWIGKTSYAGLCVLPDGRSVVINPVSGKGDVVTDVGGAVISAECKGGIINTRHSGQVSRLYKELCETVGLLMAVNSPGRQVAVVPGPKATHRLALRLVPGRAAAGIEIALVEAAGRSSTSGAGARKIVQPPLDRPHCSAS